MEMTFEEFEKFVEEVVGQIPYDYDADSFTIRDGKIIQYHTTGGAQGGNCWGDDARQWDNDKSPSPFIPLDTILKETWPEITYLKYKEIESLIVEGSDSDHEYYGNYTRYNTYALDIKQLYDKLSV